MWWKDGIADMILNRNYLNKIFTTIDLWALEFYRFYEIIFFYEI